MAIAIEVVRGDGERDGGEIRADLLGDSLTAALARGRSELDAHAAPYDRVTLELDYRDDLEPGDVIAVLEPAGGVRWVGTIVGIAHDWDGATATTTLDVERPRVGDQ